MESEPWPPVEEPAVLAILRNLTLASLVGVVFSLARRAPFLAPPITLLALWPTLGGHFVELAFLYGLRPRLPRARVAQIQARLLWWLAGGAVLGSAVIATAQLLPVTAPPWRWWWLGAPGFVALELAVHASLGLLGRPNFYRGDG